MSRDAMLANGSDETVTTTVDLVHQAGASSWCLVWTHPDYPLNTDGEPPAGEPVTWSAVATFRGRAFVVATKLRIPHKHVVDAPGRPRRCTITGSARGTRHRLTVQVACAELLAKLGANVHHINGRDGSYLNDRLAELGVTVVDDTPADAILEALTDNPRED